jgi:uncharacterized protein
MLKILISPAKSLNFDPINKELGEHYPLFKKESGIIASELKKLNPSQLSDLMNISDKLSQLNWERNKNFDSNYTTQGSKHALFAFDGDVYNGIEATSLNDKQLAFLQENLRILSGQYGYLKPFDLILPYRLEMGTNISIKGSKNLYDFWKTKITSQVKKELKEDDILINLASEEYFKVIDKKNIKNRIITPIFKDYKNGKLKTISFFAKKARGMFVRYLSDYKNQDINEYIMQFNADGYNFDSSQSSGDKYLFTR